MDVLGIREDSSPSADLNIHDSIVESHHEGDTERSVTTKLRIVLDASSHGNGSISINDAIHQGPAILPDILDPQRRSREHKYLISSDIEKGPIKYT